MKKQVKLRYSAEPLQIIYPDDYQGTKSGSKSDREFYISTTPRLLTLDEVALLEATIARLPYRQAIDFTGCVMGELDSIAEIETVFELDVYEKEHRLSSTAIAPNGGRRTLRERKLLLTERLA